MEQKIKSSGDSQLGTIRNVGIYSRLSSFKVAATVMEVINYLGEAGYHTIVESEIANHLPETGVQSADLRRMGEMCDLVIVVGGDGSLLGAARVLAKFAVPLVGVNRGRLGFLTDIKPDEIRDKLAAILAGHYIIEPHFLLDCLIKRDNKPIYEGEALNDVVLHPGKAVQMIEFELYVDGQFVYSQRSDGLIVTTPTGSTAYSLSAGGAIMHPSLDAIALVPMYPHTLSSRPIVVNGNSEIKIIIGQYREASPAVSCDGQSSVVLERNDVLYVRKKPRRLLLVHPQEHDFYKSCRSKLGWGSKLPIGDTNP